MLFYFDMSKAELSKRPRNTGSTLSTAEILSNAPLPAVYLNQFSSETPVGEVGLRRDAIRANEQIIPVTHWLQTFALNCLAIGVKTPISPEQLAILGEGSGQEIRKNRLTLYFLPFIKELNQALGKELITVTNGASRTYRLQPVRFVQDEEPHNELFERLTERGCQKFGTRVLRVIYGDIHRLTPSSMQPAKPLDDDPDPSNWRSQSACRGKDVNLFFPENDEPTEIAEKICKACSVRAECLDYAIKYDMRYGIWSGQSRNQRTRLKKKLEQS